MTPREVLLAAAELVERGWTQGYAAVGAAGREVTPGSRRAVCWCADGAIFAVQTRGRVSGDVVHDARMALLKSIGPTMSIPWWNDRPRRTQAQVARVMRKAARSCA